MGRQHRWSGWPGAWCLDCGCEDIEERMLADGFEPYGRAEDVEAKIRARYPNHPGLEDCKEPGSKRHDPYAVAAN